ncbi:MAG: EAL domain-containing protein, partial [Clostridia bacterium]|nr:EAL domain-containing protein [Clostridia bacterium]
AEALVRWIKKDGTVISPQDFIPVFEKDGLIVKLDSYMFRKVCQKQEEWLERIGHVVPVSVNLSKRHLYKGDFLSEYRQILSEYTIVPEAIKLEITEGTMAEQKEHMQEMIDHLHQMGLKILMDDFGTGYASFGMLKSLDIDVLKLDKSLVDDIGDSKGEEILKSIIKLAYALGMDVVAEGVEKKEQLDFLLQCDCRVIQGYYFSKPLCEEEFEKLLES